MESARKDANMRPSRLRREGEMPPFGCAKRGEVEGSAPVEDAWVPASGVYLTDEIFLYRVAGSAGLGAALTIELEDCFGLDIVRVSADVLRARGLRVVTPAGTC